MSLLIAIAVLIGAAVMFGIGYAVGDSGGSNSATSPAGAQVPNTPFTPRTTPNDGGTQQSPSPTAGSGAFLGVATQPASTGNGVEVTQVVPDSGADNAELQVGDVITTFDGQRVSTPAQLGTAVAAKQSGDKVEVTFTRDGQSRTATVTLGTRGTTNN